jgi:hypothetical protein
LSPIRSGLFNTLQLAFGLVGSLFDPGSETSLCRGERKVTQILHGHVITYTTGSKYFLKSTQRCVLFLYYPMRK